MEIDSWVLKFIWKSKDLEIAKNDLEKEEKFGGLILPDIKVYCEALFIKAVWYWYGKRQINRWDRTESPEIDPHLQGQLVTDKVIEAIHCGERMVFLTNGTSTTGKPQEKNERDHYLTIHKD